jgi:hypothetical protein
VNAKQEVTLKRETRTFKEKEQEKNKKIEEWEGK